MFLIDNEEYQELERKIIDCDKALKEMNRQQREIVTKDGDITNAALYEKLMTERKENMIKRFALLEEWEKRYNTKP